MTDDAESSKQDISIFLICNNKINSCLRCGQTNLRTVDFYVYSFLSRNIGFVFSFVHDAQWTERKAGGTMPKCDAAEGREAEGRATRSTNVINLEV